MAELTAENYGCRLAGASEWADGDSCYVAGCADGKFVFFHTKIESIRPYHTTSAFHVVDFASLDVPLVRILLTPDGWKQQWCYLFKDGAGACQYLAYCHTARRKEAQAILDRLDKSFYGLITDTIPKDVLDQWRS
jgi:hypothetical protein